MLISDQIRDLTEQVVNNQNIVFLTGFFAAPYQLDPVNDYRCKAGPWLHTSSWIKTVD